MKNYLVLATILGFLAIPVTSTVSFAEEGGFFKKRHERFKEWKSMSKEEKAEVRQNRKEKIEERHENWQSMTDEEKAVAKENRKNRHEARKAKAQEKYDGLSDERKEKVDAHREKIKERRSNIREKRRDYWDSLND